MLPLIVPPIVPATSADPPKGTEFAYKGNPLPCALKGQAGLALTSRTPSAPVGQNGLIAQRPNLRSIVRAAFNAPLDKIRCALGQNVRKGTLNDGGYDGVNEKGLAVHLLVLPKTKYVEPNGQPTVTYLRWIEATSQRRNFAVTCRVLGPIVCCALVSFGRSRQCQPRPANSSREAG